MSGRALGLIVTLLAWLATTSSQASPIHGAGNGATIWVPDYYGRFVRIYTFDYTVSPATFTTSKIDVAAPNCNPNALTVQDSSLYVVCNGDFGGVDQILVYDAIRRTLTKRITGIDAHGAKYFSGARLIGILFDAKGNLWTAGYASNTLLRIPARELIKGNPHIDREVIHSPDGPVSMALDKDKSIWVVGQYSGGILLNFTNAVLNAPGSFLSDNPLNPTPRYCISNSAAGCQQIGDAFNNPEGVAVLGNYVLVSNNGGNAPAATLLRFQKQPGDQLADIVYGGTANMPFACPGGLFTALGTDGKPTLWVNDEGYGVPNTDCGATAADRSSSIGRISEFTANGLAPTRAAAPIRPGSQTTTG